MLIFQWIYLVLGVCIGMGSNGYQIKLMYNKKKKKHVKLFFLVIHNYFYVSMSRLDQTLRTIIFTVEPTTCRCLADHFLHYPM